MERTPVEEVGATAYALPGTDGSTVAGVTTLIVVEARVGPVCGFGYSYTHASAAALVNAHLCSCVIGGDAMQPSQQWHAMHKTALRLGQAGIAAAAVSAVDTALWDLKARLLGVPLVLLFGPVRSSVPVYGSGTFTASMADLVEGLEGWRDMGLGAAKIKVGQHPEQDFARVRVAREAIGSKAALFVDANGAYAPRQALEKAEGFAELGVHWFEEPVSSDDLNGLRFVRERVPSGMLVSAGEYACNSHDFHRLLQAGAVDVLQADLTRCGGYTGFMVAAALADAFRIPLSSHTAPALHLPIACATRGLQHMEWFQDHARLEALCFDGAGPPQQGALHVDLSRPGHGLELKRQDLRRYAMG
ncbi:MAG: mandelate racemase [Gammaproteobacteria bacterium]|nr:mandelate racemase [Gammaproteobacteria bacterium]